MMYVVNESKSLQQDHISNDSYEISTLSFFCYDNKLVLFLTNKYQALLHYGDEDPCYQQSIGYD